MFSINLGFWPHYCQEAVKIQFGNNDLFCFVYRLPSFLVKALFFIMSQAPDTWFTHSRQYQLFINNSGFIVLETLSLEVLLTAEDLCLV